MSGEKTLTGAAERREKLRKEFWSDEDPWIGGKSESGWFQAPRTLPLILTLLNSKELSGKCNPSSVYLELLARHMGQGVVEMAHEADHAYAAGYGRRLRSWEERMKILEEVGFIKSKRIGNHYKYVFLVHPTTVAQRLRKAGQVSDEWWDTYRARQTEIKAPSYEDRQKAKQSPKVAPIKGVKLA
jgi:hypothetical protein